jgi:hypothetical protein
MQTWHLLNTYGETLVKDCAHGIFRRSLTNDEMNTVQTAFFDDFRRWRELVLKASHKIVAKFREVNR